MIFWYGQQNVPHVFWVGVHLKSTLFYSQSTHNSAPNCTPWTTIFKLGQEIGAARTLYSWHMGTTCVLHPYIRLWRGCRPPGPRRHRKTTLRYAHPRSIDHILNSNRLYKFTGGRPKEGCSLPLMYKYSARDLQYCSTIGVREHEI